MIRCDATRIERFARKLAVDTRNGLPRAVAESLNRTAFEARREWQRQMADKLVLRNTWTVGSVRVEKASAASAIATMQSRVGSLADYVAKTEAGGVRTGAGHHGKALPTTVASGEGRGGSVRRRMVRAANRMGALTIGHERPGSTPRQRNAVALSVARKLRQKTVFLEGGVSGTGIYRVRPGRKDMKPTQLYNLGRRSLFVKPHPTLAVTMAVMDRRFDRIATVAFLKQLKRAGAYGL